jgi:hypothetical protein
VIAAELVAELGHALDLRVDADDARNLAVLDRPRLGPVGAPGRGGSSAVQLVFGTSSESAAAGEGAHPNAPTSRTTSAARRTYPIPAAILLR